VLPRLVQSELAARVREHDLEVGDAEQHPEVDRQ
jgi:hypothetical protein